MLVIHPKSTCDVCLEGYSDDKLPHAIFCGHVFCKQCLESLSRLKCPLCRNSFQPTDIVRLHIDQTSPRPSSPSLPSESNSSESSVEHRRFRDVITRIVLEGAPASELRALIDECHSWLKSQPHGQHGELRASFLLMYNLTETQRKLTVETQALNEAKAALEELRVKSTADQQEAERKYQELYRNNQDEKETALAVEKSLRQHYEQLNAEWRGRYENAVAECKALKYELDRARQLFPLPHSAGLVEARYFVIDEKSVFNGAEDNLLTLKESIVTKNEIAAVETVVQNPEDMFHLSPLPANIPPLPSAIQGFAALADEDEDLNLNFPKTDVNAGAGTSDQRPYPVLRRATEPIPISSTASRIGVSALTMSKPKAHELAVGSSSSGLSLSLPRAGDVYMNSRPPSPPDRLSSAISPSSHSQAQAIPVPHTAADISKFAENTSHSSGSHKEPDRWRLKLQELLDTPSSSPTTSSMMRSQSFKEASYVRSRSSSSHSPPLATTASTSQLPPLPTEHSVISPTDTNDQSSKAQGQPPALLSQTQSSSSNLTATQRPDVYVQRVSHASSAAIALEKERQRAERERRAQTQGLSGSNSSSLRDTTNASGVYRHASIKMGVGKSKLPSVVASGVFV